MDICQKIVLFGAGGWGKEVAELIAEVNRRKPTYHLLGFIVEEQYYKPNQMINGLPLLGTERWLLEHKEEVFCNCTIGVAKEKARIQKSLMEKGVRFETIKAWNAVVPETTEVGVGCILSKRVELSVNCKIGDGVLLNAGVMVGHDTTIGDYTCIMPTTDISGNCQIGREVTIGGHVYLIPKRKVGDRAKIAAGSIVFTNVKSGTTVLGNPAKRMEGLEE